MAEGFNQAQSPLIVMALEIEAQGIFERAGLSVLYSGLGKVNAALALMRRLCVYREAGLAMPLVVNFGTAGSRKFATGATVACDRFVQRDMDLRPLGFAPGVTPFESLPPVLTFPPVFTTLPQGCCGSGDSFDTGAQPAPDAGLDAVTWDVVDMEAYAYAKVCRLEGAAFACAKYITDGADHAAAHDWSSNLPRAAAAFWDLYRGL